jgi:peptidoglycan-N-acetylmuramic acid deacetylase
MPNASHRPPQVPATATRLLHEYGGRFLGDIAENVVYLTFDEGYENGLTSQILDTLSAAGVKAAFFVTGTYIRDNADLVRRMAAEGHVVANHTYDHPSLPSLARDRSAFTEQIRATERLYRRTTGRDMAPFLRPPAGEYSPLSLCLTERLGYASVFWSFAHRDWLVDDQPPVPVTLRRILNGAIYLLHAVSRSDTEALPEAIAGLREQGYRFGTLTDLL